MCRKSWLENALRSRVQSLKSRRISLNTWQTCLKTIFFILCLFRFVSSLLKKWNNVRTINLILEISNHYCYYYFFDRNLTLGLRDATFWRISKFMKKITKKITLAFFVYHFYPFNEGNIYRSFHFLRKLYNIEILYVYLSLRICVSLTQP